MLTLSPKILVDDDQQLVVEESHFSRLAIAIVACIFAGMFVIPAVIQGTLLGLIVGFVLGTIVVGFPFLVVLLFSKYRRCTIRPGVEVTIELIYRLLPKRTVRLDWEDIERVECVRQRDTTNRPGRMTVTIHSRGQSPIKAIWGWYEPGLKNRLQARFNERFTFSEVNQLWIQ